MFPANNLTAAHEWWSAMSVAWAALGVAIVGAVTGIASLGWNIASWRQSGSVVQVQATCSGRGDHMKLVGVVRNTGRSDANLEALSLGWNPSSGGRIWCDILLADLEGDDLHGPLAAQARKQFTIRGITTIDLGLAVALHERRPVWVAIKTGSSKWVDAPIHYPA